MRQSSGLVGIGLMWFVCLSAVAERVAAQVNVPAPGGAFPVGDIQITLETAATWTPAFPDGFGPDSPNQSGDFELAPTDIVQLPDGTGRFLVPTLGGTIRVLDNNYNLLPAPLLTTTQTGSWLPEEAGMTGISVHPDFADPGTFGYGKLYTITTEQDGSGTADFGIAIRHQDVIREWDLSPLVGNSSVSSLPTATVADSRELMRVDQPGPWHNVVDLTFNTHASPGDPDYGELYISSGDGSFGHNQLVSAQDPGTIYGNILRINPDPTAHGHVHTSANTGQAAYSVSPDNFFNDGDPSTLPEVVAIGLRSPYRLNFDRQTGHLYVGDVGQNTREEVSVMVDGGENFGWGRWEGTLLFQSSVALHPGTQHDEPLFEYLTNPGGGWRGTVVGGFVYRGSLIPELQGKYVFGDFGNSQGFTGSLLYGSIDPADPDYGTIYHFDLDPEGDQFPLGESLREMPNFLFSIGEDQDGELYLVAGQDPRQFPYINDAYVIRVLPELTPRLQLTVNADTGSVWLSSPSGEVIEMAGYSILSDSGSLNVGGWNSLQQQLGGGLGGGLADSQRAE